ncbi:sulfotransferase [Luminiphilus sp.]|nr:sulfotransferase [Luminiphilus sp.]
MRIPILTYHSLNARGTDYDSNDHDALELDLTLLKENGFRVERLTTLVDAFNCGQADDYEGEKVCAITFDDGVTHDFVDFYHPDRGLLKSFARILAEATDSSRVGWEKVPATSFVIVSPDARDILDVQCIAGRNQWHHHWWEEAIRVAHFDIGNHSWDHTHPVLPDVAQRDQIRGNFFCIDNREDAYHQILDAEAFLARKLGDLRSRLFAYPYGDVPDYLRDEFFPEHESQFEAAFATGGDYWSEHSNRWAIPRFVFGEDWKTPEEFLQILEGKGGRRSAQKTGTIKQNRATAAPERTPSKTNVFSPDEARTPASDHKGRDSHDAQLSSSENTSGPTGAPEKDYPPFFIVGCVRSGTTLLRDLLKQQPNLYCPEETHLFRWPHPFGSGDFSHIQQHNETLKAHRQIDGVAEDEYRELLEQATSRRMLQDGYARLFFEAKGISGGRWFDKTPQNIYGMLLLSAVYPDAKFVHIVRHPLNVVTSLKAGKVMAKHSLQGAINTWLEAVSIANQFAVAWPERIHTMTYEALTADPQGTLTALLTFLDEPVDATRWQLEGIHPEKNLYQNTLTEAEVKAVKAQLGSLMSAFGYA